MREHIRYCLLHLNLDQSLLIIIKSTARSGICKTNTKSDDPTGRTYSKGYNDSRHKLDSSNCPEVGSFGRIGSHLPFLKLQASEPTQRGCS